MINIKESRFNIYYEIGGKKIAYNSLYSGLAEIDDNYFKLLDKIKDGKVTDFNNNEKKLFEDAKRYRYIVEDDYDELLDLRTKKYSRKFSKDKLTLTIAPTLDCNFKCIYCYETCRKGIMSNDVQNSIIDFVHKKIGNIKKLHISWYGGEPLLAKEIIYKMSKKIISICEENNIIYSSFMITNGYLLAQEDITKLKESKITGLQITLDGPPNIHNSRRVCKNGKDSYNTIIQNINLLLTENFKVHLRINIDKTNEAYIESLFSLLKDSLVNSNIKFNFGKTTSFTEICKSIAAHCYDMEEFSSKYFELYKYMVKYGFKESNPFKYPKPRYNYCGTSNSNSFVIDLYGDVYKCWNDIGDTTKTIGNITDGDFDTLSYKHGKWLFDEPIDDDKCRECKLLPLCMGGCPHQNYGQSNKRQCDAIKYNLKEILIQNYVMRGGEIRDEHDN